jgi:membrane-associated phospholipid phosphatase
VAEAPEHPLAEAAVEVLGGTPPHLERPPVSPLRPLLPEGLARAIVAFDAAAERVFERRLRGRAVPDRVFFTASALGDFSLLWHAVGAGRALVQPTFRPAARRLAAALAVESLAVNWGVKSLVRRARPTGDHVRPHRLRRPRTSSFPSGHATSGFLAATLLSEGSRAPAAWYALAGVVAASRVHVRIHHASDVVAGAAMGVAAGRLVRRRWPLPPERGRGRSL